MGNPYIDTIQDNDGNDMYPVTKTDAVYTDDNKRISEVMVRRGSQFEPSTPINLNPSKRIILSDLREETIPSGDWINGKAYTYNNVTGNSSVLKSTNYIDVSEYDAITLTIPKYAANTDYSTLFYDADKNIIKYDKFPNAGAYGAGKKIYDVSNVTYIRTSWFKDEATYGQWSCTGKKCMQESAIYVAASDSTDFDKSKSNYICSGVHDEIALNKILEFMHPCGTLYLYSGTYIIDGLVSDIDNDSPSVFVLPYAPSNSIKIKGVANTPNRKTSNLISEGFVGDAANIIMSKTCYDSLNTTSKYTILRARRDIYYGTKVYPNQRIQLENVCVNIPGNQKKICVVDGFYAASVSVKNCLMSALKSKDTSATNLDVGNSDCIAIRGTQTSNFGTGNIIESCFVWGFGYGYSVHGEHFVITDCGSRFCKFGYVFNNNNNTGNPFHPITLINCCSESDFNFPYFGRNNSNQAITMTDFNIEYDPTCFAKGGQYAKETTAGSWRGSIEYTIQSFESGNNSKNSVNIPFWESGHGGGMISRNQAQLKMGDTATRESYAANLGQEYFDLEIGDRFMFNGVSWQSMTNATKLDGHDASYFATNDSLNNTNTKLNNYILYRTETFTGHNETVTGNGYLANQSVNLSIPSGYKLLCLIEVACSNYGNLIIANPQVTNTGTVSYVVDNLRSYDNNVGGNITVKYLCVKN